MPTPSYALHVCCAPCLIQALTTVRREAAAGQPATLIFHNPNIHPLLEFRRRTKALHVYLERDRLPAVIEEEYGLGEFLRAMGPNPADLPKKERCRRCYLLRLKKTAMFAREMGLTAFSTTLLASREQDRQAIAEAGHETGKKHGLDFLEIDFRQVLAEETAFRGIYRQQYCGCIFSEEERFRGSGKHLYHSAKEKE